MPIPRLPRRPRGRPDAAPAEDPHDAPGEDDRPSGRAAAAPRGRGRSRPPRFELEFGDFEPAERTRSRTGSRDREPARPAERTRSRTGSGDREPARPAERTRSRTGGREATGPDDEPRPARRSDPVEGEIEALERFEDAIQSVRSGASDVAGSDLGARVMVAIPAGALAIFLVAQGGAVFAVGVAVFALVGVWELTQLFARTRPSLIAGSIGVVAVIAAAYGGGREAMVTALVATVPVIFVLVAFSRPRGGMPGVAVTLLGVVWLGMTVGHGVLLRDTGHGGGVVVDVLIGTFLGDTGAYLGGRMFGSRPLAPRISPNKTVEGLVIGVVSAIAATWFAGLYQDWLSGTDALLLGLAVAIAAPVGDLFESFLKRDAGQKDAGSLFGVHGGVLDRLDAAMFALVAGYYMWLALGGG